MQVCTAKMNLSDEVDLEDYVSRPDKISAAEVSDSAHFLPHGYNEKSSYLWTCLCTKYIVWMCSTMALLGAMKMFIIND